MIAPVEKLFQVFVTNTDKAFAGSQAVVCQVSTADPAPDGAYADTEEFDQVCW